MKTFQKIILLVFLLSAYIFPYSWLYVQDPQGWIGGQGTIEEAIISIKPHGIYMEYGLYLTFSARENGFTNADTLEVQFYFDLPSDAIVVDSWLWVEDEIIKGEIMDQWTASAIYEDIVNRRRDPSILFKRYENQYELRIFPMAGDETRKVKITYLAPTQWNLTNITTPIPTGLFTASYIPLQKADIILWKDSTWQNPKIVEYPDIEFVSKSDTINGDYLHAVIPEEGLYNPLTFSMEAIFNNGLFVSKYSNGTEGIYQLAFLPSEALEITISVKTAILIDFDASKSYYKKEDVIKDLRTVLINNLSEEDSFNLILSNLNIFRVSETWLPGDSATIAQTLDSLDLEIISNYSNLPSLLSNGIEFVKENGDDANILLIASSDDAGESETANDLIEDLTDMMENNIPIHVVDFQNENFNSYWIGGRTYYGNEYFYTNLTRLTSGNYFQLLYNNIPLVTLINSGFQSLTGYIGSFDLHTKLQNGFCYGRYSLNLNSPSVYLNEPVLQVGKYNGEFPFIVEASGVYKSEPFSETFTIAEEDIFQSDSLSEEAWAGNYINYLEDQPQTNNVIDEIVYQSINERVLSLYSAFLCLEPSRGGEVCYDCLDESEIPSDITDTLETEDETESLTAYPNPFNSQVNIKLRMPASLISENISMKIYNVLGEEIKSFIFEPRQSTKSYDFVWDGRNDDGASVASGIYFFMVNTPQKNFSVKLLLMK